VSEVATTPQPPSSDAGVNLAIRLSPPQQGRTSVFFRAILVLPHYVALYLLFFVAEVVSLVGWFVALILGRIPTSFQVLVTGVLRYWANVVAYGALLSGTFPKFRMEPSADSAVDFNVRHDPLNRWAVFFRIILIIPAYFLQSLLGIGVGIFLVIMWFSALFTKRTPRALHQCLATVLRYSMRLMAYLYLLTPDQPWHGWRGDAVSNTDSGEEKTSFFAISALARNLIVVAMVITVLYYVVTTAGRW
jgi:hypothetical protein